MNNSEFVNVECKQKTFNLKKEEYARWLCLIEAIDLIERKAAELKTDMISDDFWVKPLAFQKYIEQRLETMILDVDREEFKRDIILTSIPKFVEKDEQVEEDVEEPADLNIVEEVEA
jgi:hypothetical protein